MNGKKFVLICFGVLMVMAIYLIASAGVGHYTPCWLIKLSLILAGVTLVGFWFLPWS
jgi:hypothetical protein